MQEARGFTFDPDNYSKDQVDRIVVAPMDKGFMMVLPGTVIDGEGYDDEDHDVLLCLNHELLIEVDGVAYSYPAIADFVRTVKSAPMIIEG